MPNKNMSCAPYLVIYGKAALTFCVTIIHCSFCFPCCSTLLQSLCHSIVLIRYIVSEMAALIRRIISTTKAPAAIGPYR